MYKLVLACTIAGVRTINFSEFRKRASQILDLVERGETVRVFRHGKPVARIVPDDVTEGGPAWKRPRERIAVPGLSLSQAVIEERRSSS